MYICPQCKTAYTQGERCQRDRVPLVYQADFVRVGKTIGTYRLLSIIGRGGMGTVFVGEHVQLGKQVAVKLLHQRYARNADAVKRFLREARAVTAINHPNIVEVVDFGTSTADGAVFYVMEMLQGKTLDDVLAKEKLLPLHRCIPIVDQVASALAAAHDKGIIHRDLKPENIMLTPRPGARPVPGQVEPKLDFVKLLDFGIAKILRPDEVAETSQRPTEPGSIFGTPEFMAPEAARNTRIDHRADIYALGVIFYNMLTGRLPFEGGGALAIIQRHMTEPPLAPRLAAPMAEISEAAESLILKALAKAPSQRQSNMDDLRAELANCNMGDVPMMPPSPYPHELVPKPRTKRLTEELEEWVALNREEISATRQRLEAVAADPRRESPVLLTERKPR